MRQNRFTQQLKDIKTLTEIKSRYDKMMESEIKHHEDAINVEFPDMLDKIKRCVKEGDRDGLKIQLDIIKEKKDKKK